MRTWKKARGQEIQESKIFSKKYKSVQFEEDSEEDSSEDEKLKNKYCAYHGLFSHAMDACTTPKELIKR